MKKKVMFLFGSGADTDYNPKLPSGAIFSEALLGNQFKLVCKNLMPMKFYNQQLVYHSSKTIFLQTIVSNNDKASKYFKLNVIEDVVNYRNHNYTAEDDLPKRIRDFCLYCYYALNGSDKKKDDDKKYLNDNIEQDEVKNFFLCNAVFFDFLDGKFNSLRNEELDDNARRVIYTYITIFALILQCTYADNMASDFPWTYDSIWELLRTGNFVESCAQDSYYHITRNSNLEKYIATTNYTPMAECILGKETIYLHGKLSWFEDLKKLIVYDCTDESDFFILQQDKNKDIIFPFILIPSGVKPMICKKQIEQFASFSSDLPFPL